MDNRTERAITAALARGEKIELTENRDCVRVYRVSRKLIAELPRPDRNPNVKKQY